MCTVYENGGAQCISALFCYHTVCMHASISTRKTSVIIEKSGTSAESATIAVHLILSNPNLQFFQDMAGFEAI